MKSITKLELFAFAVVCGLFATLLAVAFNPAFAGGYVAPTVKPQISTTVEAERPAFSWSGPYAGLTVGKQSADLKHTTRQKVGLSDGGVPIWEDVKTAIDDSDTTYGVFAGYRWQFENRFVVGAEASYTNTGTLFDDSWIENKKLETWTVEGQVGYAIGRALPYAAVGYARIAGEDATSIAVGLDYAITDRVIIGAKYTRYDVGEITGFDNVTGFEADSDLVSLRAAIKF